MEGMVSLSLRDNTLVKILYEALQRKNGLNLLIEEGLGSLAIRARKVELVAPPIFHLDIQEMRCNNVEIEHKR